MEFSYTVSEADYWNALKLTSSPPRSAAVKTIVFWVLIMICLMVLWAVVTDNAPNSSAVHQPIAAQGPTVENHQSGTLLSRAVVNLGPFVAILGVWILLAMKRGPSALRALYRKDPTMQGEFTVNITPESISIQNTAGNSSKSGWNVYSCWREGKNVIVLMPHSRALVFSSAGQILGLAGLSDSQRAELRGILSTALPRK
jgi:hypothetical protein